MPRVAIYTLGCKLNYAESSTIGRQFVDRGFQLVESGAPADVCVINTCSVTSRADRECRQLIRRARRTSKDALIVVTGCYAQLEPHEVASMDGVDVVLGTREKFSMFDYIGDPEKQATPRVCVTEIGGVHEFGPANSGDTDGRTRAFLKVQDGCDYSCTFCTIPLARGASRSLPPDACIVQARDLVAQGYKEIVLTGVNVGCYGKDLGSNLLALLRELVTVEGLERIRISSIEPNLLTAEIIEFVAAQEKMCKHFHIPLQSGSDEVLRNMRRRYTTAQYADLVHRIRERLPLCGIGADVIVGFPGEDDEEFERTSRFLHTLPVSYLHVFTYSERRNTLAPGMARRVEPAVRFRRSAVLRLLGRKKKRAFYDSMLGRKMGVLFEGAVKDQERFGFTDNYVRVAVPAGGTEENVIAEVEIAGAGEEHCRGVLPADRMAQ